MWQGSVGACLAFEHVDGLQLGAALRGHSKELERGVEVGRGGYGEGDLWRRRPEAGARWGQSCVRAEQDRERVRAGANRSGAF